MILYRELERIFKKQPLHSYGQTEEKPVRIASVWAKIETEYFPNTSQMCHCLTDPAL